MPTTCNSLEAILKDCSNNIGGIKSVWLWSMEDQNSITEDPNAWEITTLDVTGASSPASFQGEEFQFIRNTSNYTEDGTIDLVNGSSFVTATLNLVFSRREAAKSKAIKVLGEGQRYLGALVLDNNGLYWLFQDLQISAVAEGSGTAKSDGSKYNVTLVAEVPFLAKEVTAADAATLLTTGLFS